jgi:signal transduction histidine kinase
MAAQLFTRYNRINLPIILGIFLLSGLGCYFWIDHILIADVDESLSEQAQKIDQYIDANNAFPKPEMTDEWEFSYRKTNTQTLTARFETTEQYDAEDKTDIQYRKIIYSHSLGNNNYLIIISKSLETVGGLSRSIAMTTIIALLSAIFVTLLLSHFVLKKLWMPFYQTLDLLKVFKLSKRQEITLKETGTTEFDFMNKQLSELIGSAEKDYILLKEFTENASHEMQTPVSIIRSKLDVIVQGENLSPIQSEAIGSIYQAVRRLTNLGQSLLLLAKIENNQFMDKRIFDLEVRLKDKIIQLEELWMEKDIRINQEISSSMISANPDLIDILLNNVLSNASRHNSQGGDLDIFLSTGKLVVSNSGTGERIDPNRIFSRFYKQKQHSQSNGLGLAIIKQICDQSGIVIDYDFTDQKHVFTFKW